MKIDPHQIAKLITEDVDEYAGLEDADEFEEQGDDGLDGLYIIEVEPDSDSSIFRDGRWVQVDFWEIPEERLPGPNQTTDGDVTGNFQTYASEMRGDVPQEIIMAGGEGEIVIHVVADCAGPPGSTRYDNEWVATDGQGMGQPDRDFKPFSGNMHIFYKGAGLTNDFAHGARDGWKWDGPEVGQKFIEAVLCVPQMHDHFYNEEKWECEVDYAESLNRKAGPLLSEDVDEYAGLEDADEFKKRGRNHCANCLYDLGDHDPDHENHNWGWGGLQGIATECEECGANYCERCRTNSWGTADQGGSHTRAWEDDNFRKVAYRQWDERSLTADPKVERNVTFENPLDWSKYDVWVDPEGLPILMGCPACDIPHGIREDTDEYAGLEDADEFKSRYRYCANCLHDLGDWHGDQGRDPAAECEECGAGYCVECYGKLQSGSDADWVNLRGSPLLNVTSTNPLDWSKYNEHIDDEGRVILMGCPACEFPPTTQGG
jgi:hypothetical protein